MTMQRDTLCPACRQTLGRGPLAFFRSAAVFHLFFVLCSFGLWIPVWLWSLRSRRRLGLCTECGADLQPQEPSQTNTAAGPERPDTPTPRDSSDRISRAA